MILLTFPSKIQRTWANDVRERRLHMGLTQQGLARRSGVPLATLRKFEQKGKISLESFLKLLWVVGGLEEMTQALKPAPPDFRSIDEVLNVGGAAKRKRGRKK